MTGVSYSSDATITEKTGTDIFASVDISDVGNVKTLNHEISFGFNGLVFSDGNSVTNEVEIPEKEIGDWVENIYEPIAIVNFNNLPKQKF